MVNFLVGNAAVILKNVKVNGAGSGGDLLENGLRRFDVSARSSHGE